MNAKNAIRDILVVGLLVLPIVPGGSFAAETAETEFFEKHVRPLLVDRCGDCHGEDLAESKLRVDSLAGLLRGGLRGPAIVAGKPESSLLIRAVRHDDRLQMPPKEKLSAAEIAALTQWVAEGAVWPDAEPIATQAEPPATARIEFSDEERGFWAFRPPARPAVPAVRDLAWVRTPIDAFILAGLEQAGLAPAPPADRRTLIRRVTFDLTGLPPTPEEVQAFLADDSPDAFARVVDRLLDSPRYGERWGRHWLDVARYADSNGLDENLAYANAFRYRDYVIAAFNRDKPYDRFVQEQIAGDLLPDDGTPGNQLDRIVATGFLCIGPKMLAEDDPVKLQMDIIDEQVDTVGRAFMGLTLGCARCHDHKFDPIPTSDYYSLAGIFKSTRTMDTFTVVAQWHERLLAAPESLAARDTHQQQIDAATRQIESLRSEAVETLQAVARRHVGDYLLAAESQRRRQMALAELKPIGDDPELIDRRDVILREAEQYDRGNVLRDTTNYGQGIGVLVNRGETPNYVEYDVDVPAAGMYRFEVRYAAAGARPCRLLVNGAAVLEDVADGVTGTWLPDSQRWEIEGFVSLRSGKNTLRLEQPQFFPHIDKWLLAPAPAAVVAEQPPLDPAYQRIPAFVRQWREWLQQSMEDSDHALAAAWKVAASHPDASRALRKLAADLQQEVAAENSESASLPPADLRRAVSELIASKDGPFRAFDSIESHFSENIGAELQSLRDRQQELQRTLPQLPSAMAVDDSRPENIPVHYRGSHLTLGPVVPRRFPRILAGEDPAPIADDRSGRRELARWLASPEHPLTARVLVNRVWHWHFGSGLVRTPDNFGRLGERPTHPELLDWLADEFVRSGWSVKRLHRLILLSSTWQMSSAFNTQAAAQDPENRLWWRMPRRRLEAEEIRDAVLALSGRLELSMGGSLLSVENRKYVTSTANVDPVVYQTDRRSVYLPVVRSALYEVFQAFDFADPSVISGTRQSTTVAPQALFMMNSDLVAISAETMAERLLAESSWEDARRVQDVYLSAYARPAAPEEVQRALQFIAGYEARWRSSRPEQEARARLRAWQSFCRAVMASNEFVFVE